MIEARCFSKRRGAETAQLTADGNRLAKGSPPDLRRIKCERIIDPCGRRLCHL